ncbi:sensor histidine kinase [Flavilitoribacter nigricans]|uniref:Histidine kinase n=1 Tax=Flavilitoribacter nigricans (strain ATCC 23147 / DSM 23189 / NBRC 102662 / NCIMB 1420 / SS-2) TaxID=1122177 RepID=A0A2D0NIN3_FLAN2|nr:histidine kinase [Flavilitoribacter nigricans]PHN08365.1 histidine kinase [Flavilitoribacter nigricans DSM 23189 = NBRC 102662]
MLLKIYRNKWKIFGLIALVSLSIPILIVATVLITTGQESVRFFENSNPVFAVLILSYYILIIALGLVWLIQQIISIFRLKNETVKMELRHLQGQVNPHFFFNILNNLYGMVEKDTRRAQDLIIKLSDMMRYSIHEGQREYVTLAEEVDYLKNYVALHQMRYHKTIDVQFAVDIPDEEWKVRPLLFIILTENAFKHGVEQLRSGAFIHIRLQATSRSIEFEVTNNFDPEAAAAPSGVGLKNLRRRLNLAYPKRHELSLHRSDGIYKASLKLQSV